MLQRLLRDGRTDAGGLSGMASPRDEGLFDGVVETLPRWRFGPAAERTALFLYLLVLAGFYWTPSRVAGLHRAHDVAAFFGLLPAVVLGLGPRLPGLFRRSPVAAASALFVGYLAASVAWASGPIERDAGTVLLHAAATLGFVAASALLLDANRSRIVSRFVVVCGSTLSALAIAFFVASDATGGVDRLRSPVSLDHPNVIGYFLGFAGIVALHRLLRAEPSVRGLLPASAAFGFTVAALLLTRGRLTLVAFLVAAAVALARAPDRRLARAGAGVGLAAAAVAGLFSTGVLNGFVERSDAGRGTIWAELVRRSEGHWLLGMGLTARDDVTFPPGSPDFPAGHIAPHGHSLVVGTFFFGGVVGLGLLLAVLALAIRGGLRLAARGSPLALTLLAYGAVALSMNGQWAVSGPHEAAWLLVWLPVGLVAGAEARGAPAPAPDSPGPGVEAGRGISRNLAAAIGVALLAVRLPYLKGPLLEPHAWRQLDALHAIRGFARDGIDLLRPPVAWLGTEGVAVFGFPAVEALSAFVLRFLGGDLAVPRAVFFLLFVVSALATASIARQVGGRTRSIHVLLAALALPAGVLTSTALLPDATGLAFTTAAFALLLRGLVRRRPGPFAGGVLLLALALVVKPAFAVPFIPLVLAAALRRRSRAFAGRYGALLAVPVAALLGWQGHVEKVRTETAEAPLYPSAARPVNDLGRSFVWAEPPPSIRTFLRVGESVVADLCGPGFLAAALVGGLLVASRSRPLFALLASGAALYVVLFLPACARHDWELLAILPVIAILAGEGLAWVCQARAGLLRGLAVLAVVAVLLGGVVDGGRRRHPGDPAERDAAALVSAHCPPGDLVVVSWGGLGGRSPYMLVDAERRGWSVPESELSMALMDELASRGATRLAILSSGPAPGFLVRPPVVDAPVGRDGVRRLRIWEIPRPRGRERSQRSAARSFLLHVARNCGFVTSKSFSAGAS
jgi:hypothetical protein